MRSYRVYLTDRENKKSVYKFNSKEEVKECINDANKAGFYEFRIILHQEGTDIHIKTDKFKDGYEKIVQEALEYEYKIEGVKIIRYKPEKSQDKKSQEAKPREKEPQTGNPQEGRTQEGDGR